MYRLEQKVRVQCFVYYQPLLISASELIQKVVESFNQDVQCVRHDLRSQAPDDKAIDHQQH